MCDLKRSGAYKYSLDPTTKPTCLAFKILGEPTIYFLDYHAINRPWREQPQKLRDLWVRLIEEGYQFTGHNAFFEKCIYANILVARYGWPRIPFRLYRCTAAKAAACALPRSLEGVGEVLKLRIQKDKAGYVAMMATCKPTKKWNEWRKAREEVFAGKRVGVKKQMIAAAEAPPMFIEPWTHPEVFETLYRYCKIDVRTEELVDLSLPDLIPSEQEIWFQNQMLNWRGLPIDIPTVQKIVSIMAEESTTKLKELDALTMGLVTKPGSRNSVLEFLRLEGIELPNLQSKTVDDFLTGFKLSGDMHRLLEIRKALSMASTKKYHAMLQRANDDERVRDILLYHGASTGRDSGTGLQPHNFPKGLIRVDKRRPYAAVENVVECDAEMLRLLYGESLGILFSAILRNMIIPTKGHDLFVADFSKVEVAVLWWLAGNEPGLKILRGDLNPYRYQDAKNRGVSYLETLDEGEFYQLGKAQILGCLAEGTVVLTKLGRKYIQYITSEDRLWDGEKWVRHGGLVPRGLRPVIRNGRENIESTVDHWFYRRGAWRTAVEIVSEEVMRPRPLGQKMEVPPSSPENSNEEVNAVSVCAAYAELKKKFELINLSEDLIYYARDVHSRLTGSEAVEKETLISWLIQNLESVGQRVSTTLNIDVRIICRRTTTGTVVAALSANSKPSEIFWNTLLRCAGLISGGCHWTELITAETMKPETYELLVSQLTTKIKETYDILDVGDRNRFQVEEVLTHNCGFGMGAVRFQDTAWTMYRLKLSFKQSKEAVTSYREANPKVPELWEAYERAALEVVKKGGEVRAGKCRFLYDRQKFYGGVRFLWVILPSGRPLAYADPQIAWRVRQYETAVVDARGHETRVTKISDPLETLEFWGVNSKTKKWALERTWGGTLAENITQATARDLLMPGMVRLEKRGYRGLLMVHDEPITEKKIGTGSVEEFVEILCEPPPWAGDMPISAKGWTGPRYRKN